MARLCSGLCGLPTRAAESFSSPALQFGSDVLCSHRCGKSDPISIARARPIHYTRQAQIRVPQQMATPKLARNSRRVFSRQPTVSGCWQFIRRPFWPSGVWDPPRNPSFPDINVPPFFAGGSSSPAPPSFLCSHFQMASSNKEPMSSDEESPMTFPDDFPLDLRFLRPLDHAEPPVTANFPFESFGQNVFRRLSVFVGEALRTRPWNVPSQFLRLPVPRPVPEYVERMKYEEFKRRTDAQIAFMKNQIKNHDAQMRKMRIRTTGLTEQMSKEQEILRRYIQDVAADVRQQLARGDKYYAPAEQVAELKRLLEELSLRVGAMKPVKSKFKLRDLDSLLKLFSTVDSLVKQMFLLSGLVTVFLQYMGYLKPDHIIGPPLYEIAEKKTNEFLLGDYCTGMHMNVQSMFSNGLAVATRFSSVNGVDSTNIIMKYTGDKFNLKVNSDLLNSVAAKVSFDEVCRPDTKLIMQMGFPYNMTAKVKTLHKYGAFTASLGHNMNPLACVSASLGMKGAAVGGLLEMDPVQRIIRRYSAGVTLSDDMFTAKVSWNKLDDVNVSVLKAAVLCEVTERTTLATQYERNFTTNAELVTFGIEHALDEDLKLKTRFSHDGTIAAMIKQRLSSYSTLAMSTQFNFRDHDVAPRYGLSFSYCP